MEALNVKVLEQFLKEQIDNLSKEEAEAIKYQLELIKKCHENFHKVILKVETSEDIKKRLNDGLEKLVGIENV